MLLIKLLAQMIEIRIRYVHQGEEGIMNIGMMESFKRCKPFKKPDRHIKQANNHAQMQAQRLSLEAKTQWIEK